MKTVLLVEDNENDIFAMKMACQRTGIPHNLQVVSDGDAAIEYFTGKRANGDPDAHPLPDLVFLDIKMPRKNGHEVLEWVRSQPQLKHLPVVILTGGEEPSDIDRAYKLGVTSYLRKMSCPVEFGQAVPIILKYWLELNITSQ